MATSYNYLRPTSGVLDDDALADLIQQVVVGITGLPGNMVRPRWQPDAPNTPDVSLDWVAFGTASLAPQWNAYQYYDKVLDTYFVEGTQVVECLFSFYGPNHSRHREEFLDGLQLDMNLQQLVDNQIKFMSFASPVQVPALFKNQYRLRSDVKVFFNRWVKRAYPVGYYSSASGSIDNEKFVTPFSVNPPSP